MEFLPTYRETDKMSCRYFSFENHTFFFSLCVHDTRLIVKNFNFIVNRVKICGYLHRTLPVSFNF